MDSKINSNEDIIENIETNTDKAVIANSNMESKTDSKKISKRLMSVDALRGFDMLWIIGGREVLVGFAMIFGAGTAEAVEVNFHHAWGQFHFWDLIMPLFLFIVGVVMPIAFGRRLERGNSKKDIYMHVVRRVIILYILGLIASGHLLTYNLSRIHLWTDTLHAIAVGYLFSSILLLELKLRWQLIITIALLFIYWGVMALISIPGVGAGFYEPKMNLAFYIDNLVLGHWQEGEGWTYILTNMTFISNVMIGVFAGQLLLSKQSEMKKTFLLTALGVGCIIVGKIWGIWFPIIHHLWTSSLVLYSCGWSFLLLALFYLIIDVWGFKKWSFVFIVIGMNAIAVYVATHLFNFSLIGNIFVGGLSKWIGAWNEFVQSLAALAIVWFILYWMYRKKTFIKI